MSAGASGNGCVFCEIIADREPASVVYSDDTVLAFLDVAQINTGHLLVVPRLHAQRLADLDEAAGTAMFRVAQRLAAALRASGLPCDGVNLLLSDGEVAGQEVPHVHLHVLPRTPGDDYKVQVTSHPTTRTALDQTAARIRASLTSRPAKAGGVAGASLASEAGSARVTNGADGASVTSGANGASRLRRTGRS